MRASVTKKINETGQAPAATDNTKVWHIPKPGAQTVVLGLVALITLAQTVQLMRISSKANATSVRTVAPSSSSSDGMGDDTNTPQAMVGGC